MEDGDPDRIRTCDIQLRRLTLYPTELRGLIFDKNRRYFNERKALMAKPCRTILLPGLMQLSGHTGNQCVQGIVRSNRKLSE